MNPDLKKSHFLDSLKILRVADETEAFRQFLKVVTPISSTLPLLLRNKKTVFKALINALTQSKDQNTDEMVNFEVFLGILLAFAEDLREEFNPFLLKTIRLLTPLLVGQTVENSLNERNTKTLFETFQSLFGLLSPYPATIFPSILNEWIQLLIHPSNAVKPLAIQSLSSILRFSLQKSHAYSVFTQENRSQDTLSLSLFSALDHILNTILSTVFTQSTEVVAGIFEESVLASLQLNRTTLRESISTLLFESVKGAYDTFSFRSSDLVEYLLHILRDSSTRVETGKLPAQTFVKQMEIIHHFLTNMYRHGTLKTLGSIPKHVISNISSAVAQCKSSPSIPKFALLGGSISFLSLILSIRKGEKLGLSIQEIYVFVLQTLFPALADLFAELPSPLVTAVYSLITALIQAIAHHAHHDGFWTRNELVQQPEEDVELNYYFPRKHRTHAAPLKEKQRALLSLNARVEKRFSPSDPSTTAVGLSLDELAKKDPQLAKRLSLYNQTSRTKGLTDLQIQMLQQREVEEIRNEIIEEEMEEDRIEARKRNKSDRISEVISEDESESSDTDHGGYGTGRWGRMTSHRKRKIKTVAVEPAEPSLISTMTSLSECMQYCGNECRLRIVNLLQVAFGFFGVQNLPSPSQPIVCLSFAATLPFLRCLLVLFDDSTKFDLNPLLASFCLTHLKTNQKESLIFAHEASLTIPLVQVQTTPSIQVESTSLLSLIQDLIPSREKIGALATSAQTFPFINTTHSCLVPIRSKHDVYQGESIPTTQSFDELTWASFAFRLINQLWDRQSDDRQVAMLKTKPFHTLDDTDLSLFSSNIARITDTVSQQRLVLFQRLMSFVDQCMDNQTQSSMPSSTQTVMLALSCQALFTASTLILCLLSEDGHFTQPTTQLQALISKCVSLLKTHPTNSIVLHWVTLSLSNIRQCHSSSDPNVRQLIQQFFSSLTLVSADMPLLTNLAPLLSTKDHTLRTTVLTLLCLFTPLPFLTHTATESSEEEEPENKIPEGLSLEEKKKALKKQKKKEKKLLKKKRDLDAADPAPAETSNSFKKTLSDLKLDDFQSLQDESVVPSDNLCSALHACHEIALLAELIVQSTVVADTDTTQRTLEWSNRKKPVVDEESAEMLKDDNNVPSTIRVDQSVWMPFSVSEADLTPLGHLLPIHTIETGIDNSYDASHRLTILLNAIIAQVRSGRIPLAIFDDIDCETGSTSFTPAYSFVLLSFAIGLLSVPMKTIWEPTKELIYTIINSEPSVRSVLRRSSLMLYHTDESSAQTKVIPNPPRLVITTPSTTFSIALVKPKQPQSRISEEQLFFTPITAPPQFAWLSFQIVVETKLKQLQTPPAPYISLPPYSQPIPSLGFKDKFYIETDMLPLVPQSETHQSNLPALFPSEHFPFGVELFPVAGSDGISSALTILGEAGQDWSDVFTQLFGASPALHSPPIILSLVGAICASNSLLFGLRSTQESTFIAELFSILALLNQHSTIFTTLPAATPSPHSTFLLSALSFANATTRTGAGGISEQFGEWLFNVFVGFVRQTYAPLHSDTALLKLTKNSPFEPSSSPSISKKHSAEILLVFLDAFCSFKNPNQIPSSPLLWELLQRLITSTDTAISKKALQCIFNFKIPQIKPYEDQLMSLLDEKQFRNSLSVFSPGTNTTQIIQQEHRLYVIPILERILYGALFRRLHARAHGHSALSVRRSAIFTFLSALPASSELVTIISLLTEPFELCLRRGNPHTTTTRPSTQFSTIDEYTSFLLEELLPTLKTDNSLRFGLTLPVTNSSRQEIAHSFLEFLEGKTDSSIAQFLHTLLSPLSSELSVSVQNGFLNTFVDFVGSMTALVSPYVPFIMTLTSVLLLNAVRFLSTNPADRTEYQSIVQNAFKLLAVLFSDFDHVFDEDSALFADSFAFHAIYASIQFFYINHSGEDKQLSQPFTPNLLKLFAALTKKPVLCVTFISFDVPERHSLFSTLVWMITGFLPQNMEKKHISSDQAKTADSCVTVIENIFSCALAPIIQSPEMGALSELDQSVSDQVVPVLTKTLPSLLSEFSQLLSILLPPPSSSSASVRVSPLAHRVLSLVAICALLSEENPKAQQDLATLLLSVLPSTPHTLKTDLLVCYGCLLPTVSAEVLLSTHSSSLAQLFTSIPPLYGSLGMERTLFIREKNTDKKPKKEVFFGDDQSFGQRHLRTIVKHFHKQKLSTANNDVVLPDLFTNARQQLCATIKVLTAIVSKQFSDNNLIKSTANFISNFASNVNRMDPNLRDEPDVTSRLDAYNTLITSFSRLARGENDHLQKEAFGEPLLRGLLSILYIQTTGDLLCPDVQIRRQAFETASSTVLTATRFKTEGRPELSNTLLNIYTKATKDNINNKTMDFRNTHLKLLAMLIKAYPEQFDDLQGLLNEDENQDFFACMTHIQQHRHIKAHQLFRKLLKQAELRSKSEMLVDKEEDETDKEEEEEESEEERSQQPVVAMTVNHLTSYFVPLFTQQVLEGSQSDGSFNISAQAQETLKMVAAKLTWKPYSQTLLSLILNISRKPQKEKQYTSLVTLWMDAFPFSKSDLTDKKISMLSQQILPPLISLAEKLDPAVSTLSSFESNEVTTVQNGVASDVLHTSVLIPTLHSEKKAAETDMSSTAAKRIGLSRLDTAAATAKLLKRIGSPQLVSLHLPKIVLLLAQHLKSRDEDVRGAVRKTFISIVSTFGSLYFGFILQELRRTLTRGYQVHVLTFTVKQMLAHLVQNAGKDGLVPIERVNIDYCASEVIDLAVKELFGRQSEEKDVKQLANRFSEMKKTSGYELFSLVGQLVRKFELVKDTVSRLGDLCVEVQDAKIIARVRECFTRLSSGLALNVVIMSNTQISQAHSEHSNSREMLNFVLDSIYTVFGRKSQKEIAPLLPQELSAWLVHFHRWEEQRKTVSKLWDRMTDEQEGPSENTIVLESAMPSEDEEGTSFNTDTRTEFVTPSTQMVIDETTGSVRFVHNKRFDTKEYNAQPERGDAGEKESKQRPSKKPKEKAKVIETGPRKLTAQDLMLVPPEPPRQGTIKVASVPNAKRQQIRNENVCEFALGLLKVFLKRNKFELASKDVTETLRELPDEEQGPTEMTLTQQTLKENWNQYFFDTPSLTIDELGLGVLPGLVLVIKKKHSDELTTLALKCCVSIFRLNLPPVPHNRTIDIVHTSLCRECTIPLAILPKLSERVSENETESSTLLRTLLSSDSGQQQTIKLVQVDPFVCTAVKLHRYIHLGRKQLCSPLFQLLEQTRTSSSPIEGTALIQATYSAIASLTNTHATMVESIADENQTWSLILNLDGPVTSSAKLLFTDHQLTLLVNTVRFDIMDTFGKSTSAAQLYQKQNTIRNEKVKRQTAVLQLLGALLSLKVISTEMYDLMSEVADLMLIGSSEIRKRLSDCYLTFLLTYPLTDARLQHHLTRLLKSVSHPLAEVRLSCCECIRQLITRFPIQFLQNQSGIIFLTLAAQIPHEHYEAPLATIQSGVSLLLSRCPTKQLEDSVKYIRTWISSPFETVEGQQNKQMSTTGSVALHLLPLFIVVLGSTEEQRKSLSSSGIGRPYNIHKTDLFVQSQALPCIPSVNLYTVDADSQPILSITLPDWVTLSSPNAAPETWHSDATRLLKKEVFPLFENVSSQICDVLISSLTEAEKSLGKQSNEAFKQFKNEVRNLSQLERDIEDAMSGEHKRTSVIVSKRKLAMAEEDEDTSIQKQKRDQDEDSEEAMESEKETIDNDQSGEDDGEDEEDADKAQLTTKQDKINEISDPIVRHFLRLPADSQFELFPRLPPAMRVVVSQFLNDNQDDSDGLDTSSGLLSFSPTAFSLIPNTISILDRFIDILSSFLVASSSGSVSLSSLFEKAPNAISVLCQAFRSARTLTSAIRFRLVVLLNHFVQHIQQVLSDSRASRLREQLLDNLVDIAQTLLIVLKQTPEFANINRNPEMPKFSTSYTSSGKKKRFDKHKAQRTEDEDDSDMSETASVPVSSSLNFSAKLRALLTKREEAKDSIVFLHHQCIYSNGTNDLIGAELDQYTSLVSQLSTTTLNLLHTFNVPLRDDAATTTTGEEEEEGTKEKGASSMSELFVRRMCRMALPRQNIRRSVIVTATLLSFTRSVADIAKQQLGATDQAPIRTTRKVQKHTQKGTLIAVADRTEAVEIQPHTEIFQRLFGHYQPHIMTALGKCGEWLGWHRAQEEEKLKSIIQRRKHGQSELFRRRKILTPEEKQFNSYVGQLTANVDSFPFLDMFQARDTDLSRKAALGFSRSSTQLRELFRDTPGKLGNDPIATHPTFAKVLTAFGPSTIRILQEYGDYLVGCYSNNIHEERLFFEGKLNHEDPSRLQYQINRQERTIKDQNTTISILKEQLKMRQKLLEQQRTLFFREINIICEQNHQKTRYGEDYKVSDTEGLNPNAWLEQLLGESVDQVDIETIRDKTQKAIEFAEHKFEIEKKKIMRQLESLEQEKNLQIEKLQTALKQKELDIDTKFTPNLSKTETELRRAKQREQSLLAKNQENEEEMVKLKEEIYYLKQKFQQEEEQRQVEREAELTKQRSLDRSSTPIRKRKDNTDDKSEDESTSQAKKGTKTKENREAIEQFEDQIERLKAQLQRVKLDKEQKENETNDLKTQLVLRNLEFSKLEKESHEHSKLKKKWERAKDKYAFESEEDEEDDEAGTLTERSGKTAHQNKSNDSNNQNDSLEQRKKNGKERVDGSVGELKKAKTLEADTRKTSGGRPKNGNENKSSEDEADDKINGKDTSGRRNHRHRSSNGNGGEDESGSEYEKDGTTRKPSKSKRNQTASDSLVSLLHSAGTQGSDGLDVPEEQRKEMARRLGEMGTAVTGMTRVRKRKATLNWEWLVGEAQRRERMERVGRKWEKRDRATYGRVDGDSLKEEEDGDEGRSITSSNSGPPISPQRRTSITQFTNTHFLTRLAAQNEARRARRQALQEKIEKERIKQLEMVFKATHHLIEGMEGMNDGMGEIGGRAVGERREERRPSLHSPMAPPCSPLSFHQPRSDHKNPSPRSPRGMDRRRVELDERERVMDEEQRKNVISPKMGVPGFQDGKRIVKLVPMKKDDMWREDKGRREGRREGRDIQDAHEDELPSDWNWEEEDRERSINLLPPQHPFQQIAPTQQPTIHTPIWGLNRDEERSEFGDVSGANTDRMKDKELRRDDHRQPTKLKKSNDGGRKVEQTRRGSVKEPDEFRLERRISFGREQKHGPKEREPLNQPSLYHSSLSPTLAVSPLISPAIPLSRTFPPPSTQNTSLSTHAIDNHTTHTSILHPLAAPNQKNGKTHHTGSAYQPQPHQFASNQTPNSNKPIIRSPVLPPILPSLQVLPGSVSSQPISPAGSPRQHPPSHPQTDRPSRSRPLLETNIEGFHTPQAGRFEDDQKTHLQREGSRGVSRTENLIGEQGSEIAFISRGVQTQPFTQLAPLPLRSKENRPNTLLPTLQQFIAQNQRIDERDHNYINRQKPKVPTRLTPISPHKHSSPSNSPQTTSRLPNPPPGDDDSPDTRPVSIVYPSLSSCAVLTASGIVDPILPLPVAIPGSPENSRGESPIRKAKATPSRTFIPLIIPASFFIDKPMPPKRGRGKRGGMGNFNAQKKQRQSPHTKPNFSQKKNKFKLLVKGFEPTISGITIQKFLLQNATGQTKILNPRMDQGTLSLEFSTQADMITIKRLNGINMPDGRKIFITEVQTGGKPAQVLNKVYQYVQQAYNSNTKVLDLSNMFHHSTMQKGTRSIVDFGDAQFVKTLASAINAKAKEVHSLDLSGNQIRTLIHFQPFETIPTLRELNLGGNLIGRVSEVDYLSKIKLTLLILDGNPLKQNIDPLHYFANVKAQLPFLTVLDDHQYPTGVIKTNHELPPLRLFCGDSDEQVRDIESFLQNFLIEYDNARQNLYPLYTPCSTFSLTDDSSTNVDSQQISYNGISRNISNVKALDQRRRRLFVGRDEIVQLFTQLPPTRHDYNSIDVSLFTIPFYIGETKQTVDMANLRFDGAFEDVHAKKPKHYSRTLLLVGASDELIQKGIMYNVISDHLHIFNIAATRVTPSPIDPNAHGILPPSDVVQPGDPQNAAEMIMEVHKGTNMQPYRCRDLLINTNWNFEQAGILFTQMHQRNQIPADYFMP
ncbi:putative Nuclear RNA export factor 1 [Blattamonas nauphoetae]|uniref:Nuclear RNA export factor 1 n=1 Tax=Blattamonas nauphoetae TaxID=2049346 RepID=A0ABQ9XAH7_9EUKA|nr:putative Nuclear RNA export factor 1 [Blattamonas nauphoetae]